MNLDLGADMTNKDANKSVSAGIAAAKVFVQTFGNYDILIDGVSALGGGLRHQGFLRLFVFFVLNRDKVFSPNAIIEKVWPNKDYHDNNAVVRTQIFRLKKHLSELAPQINYRLEFMHGGYYFSLENSDLTVDADLFAKLYDLIVSEASETSIGLFETRFSDRPASYGRRTGEYDSVFGAQHGGAASFSYARSVRRRDIPDNNADSGGSARDWRRDGGGVFDGGRIKSVFVSPTGGLSAGVDAGGSAGSAGVAGVAGGARGAVAARSGTAAAASAPRSSAIAELRHGARAYAPDDVAEAKRAAKAAVSAALSGIVSNRGASVFVTSSIVRSGDSSFLPVSPSADAGAAAQYAGKEAGRASAAAVGKAGAAGKAAGALVISPQEKARKKSILRRCKEAFALYRDGFLRSDTFDGEWVAMHRLNYRRMWFRIVEIYVNISFADERFDDVIEFCQNALQFESSEEYIHEIYMDALRKAGYVSDAITHYESLLSSHKRNEAALGSARLKEIYRSALRDLDNKQLVDRSDIEKFLFDLAGERGALICGKDDFLGHCRVVKEISDRTRCNAFICIVEIVGMESMGRAYRKLCDTEYLTPMFAKALRSSDALCAWNDKQILILIACERQLEVGGLLRRVLQEITADNQNDPEVTGVLRGGVKRLPLSIRMLPFGADVMRERARDRELAND